MEGAVFDKWLVVIGTCETIAIVLAFISVTRFGVMRRFPSLLFSLIIELATDVSLLILLHHPRLYTAYFYTYWASVFLQSAMRLWIIADVVRSIPGIGFMPRSVYLFIGLSGATMAFASAMYCLHRSGGPQLEHCLSASESIRCLAAWMRNDIASVVILIDRCVCIAWMAFSVSLLLCIKVLRLGWSPIGAHVANGITARICACFIVSRLISGHSAQARHWANGFESLCSIAVFLFWFYQFSRPPQIPEPAWDDKYTQSSLEALLAIRSGREG
jgi:hypothetical protein